LTDPKAVNTGLRNCAACDWRQWRPWQNFSAVTPPLKYNWIR